MLIKAKTLKRIAAGEVTLAFRRWKKPTVKAGGTLRTPLGMLGIVAVDEVDESTLDDGQARAADFDDLAVLLAALGDRPGTLHRVRFGPITADPLLTLRETVAVGDDAAELRKRLARLDRASKSGPWARTILETIRDNPGVRAPDLAASLGREKPPFKRDVRKLKYLGLTISLKVGYELSARGRAWLDGE